MSLNMVNSPFFMYISVFIGKIKNSGVYFGQKILIPPPPFSSWFIFPKNSVIFKESCDDFKIFGLRKGKFRYGVGLCEILETRLKIREKSNK